MLRRENGNKFCIFVLSMIVSFFVLGGVAGVIYEIYDLVH
jgi:hypothetical protein